MTVEFNCPTCDALIAFDSKHCGKCARCTTCGQRFIIPCKNYETPEKVEPEPQTAEPLPGFYKAVFIDSFKLFANSANVTGLVFVTAAVCFKFFTGHTDYSFTVGAGRFQAPVGLVVTLAAWGCLFWYYMEIIRTTTTDADLLPDIYMDGFFGFVWNIVKSLYLFFITLVTVQLPCIISIIVLKNMQIQLPILTYTLMFGGLFVFPMAILIMSLGLGVDMALKPARFFRPVIRAFWPYLTVVAIFILAWTLQFKISAYGDLVSSSKTIVALYLFADIAAQAIAIIAIRSIGLFYRHYSCHLPW